jgi:RIO kinase 1
MDGQFDDVDDTTGTPLLPAAALVEAEVISTAAVSNPIAKKVKKSKKTPVITILEPPIEVIDDGRNAGEEDTDFSFDALESMLLNDGSYTGGAKGSMGGSDFGKKINLSTRVQNDITRSEKKGEKRLNDCGKDDRATSEQVLDPRTRLILFKLLNNGFLSAIDGCLSTGKEANVYYAKGEQGQEYAVKIFKTSILVFKDRDRYVSGEYRFRNGYCKSNPRKMVQTWAEKEMRNLKRLVSASVPCPTPHLLKSHVLVMDFLGMMMMMFT